jgi:hypothetical protein
MDDYERFWSKVESVGGCRLWRAAVDKTSGRGRFKAEGRTWDVQRLAWAEENGPVPTGCVAYAICGDNLCVKQSHLAIKAVSIEGKAALTKISAEDAEEACSFIDDEITAGRMDPKQPQRRFRYCPVSLYR